MRELYYGRLYWPELVKEHFSYPPLDSDKQVTVAIIGGGISGAVCAYVLAKSGIDACILERGEVAGGSTSANSGLLQFSSDIMLVDLIRQIGEKDAVSFYKASRQALEQLAAIVAELKTDVGYTTRSSLYYASAEEDEPKLRSEYEKLRSCGFEVEYWGPRTIGERYPFHKPGAIWTCGGDAEINPLQFVYAVAEGSCSMGQAIYERTEVVAHETLVNGVHRLKTSSGAAVDADHVIYAIGYEPEELKGRLIKADLNRTYAIATGPQHELAAWYGRSLIWETSRPNFYMRTTPEGRVIAGGLDEEAPRPLQDDEAMRKRSDKLLARIQEHFPGFQAPAEFEWTGIFGESRDNLPFIGEDPNRPGVYYCLGYGGNGTTYSLMASTLLHDLICGSDHPIAQIVRLDRPSLQKIQS
ncbi:FAD-binding oxidoreductase [Paenibacillus sp. sptzw28]|uniref:NAD(P)/FAD-dependent oxidoreductase n=1 Tax=Paenibacillus sp. sptzw28 TaxID=715179 RepID=UPI001C6DED40|nr:FAD-binding oxidoreductase [Paenibacillus sp. sptzw28]QYR20594.1 FAD-binding oxidoreductase [Paenibacillus sp. sptzw28]